MPPRLRVEEPFILLLFQFIFVFCGSSETCRYLMLFQHLAYPVFRAGNQCGQPEVPENGHVIFHSSGALVSGATVSYKCDVGFILVGPEQRVCESSGGWSEHAPVCGKMNPWL